MWCETLPEHMSILLRVLYEELTDLSWLGYRVTCIYAKWYYQPTGPTRISVPRAARSALTVDVMCGYSATRHQLCLVVSVSSVGLQVHTYVHMYLLIARLVKSSLNKTLLTVGRLAEWLTDWLTGCLDRRRGVWGDFGDSRHCGKARKK